MSRRTTGVSFIAIATVLFITKFFAAAIWGGNFSTWSAENFAALLGYVDQGLTNLSIIALVIGLVYLVWGEVNERKR
jgi:hypothetical protein